VQSTVTATRRLLLTTTLLQVLVPCALADTITYRTVALTGQAAPGTGGATYADLLGYWAPALTGDSVVFGAVLSGSGVTTANDAGVRHDQAGSLRLLAREGARPAEADPARGPGRLRSRSEIARWLT
jgi:hypothetical protein